MFRKRQLTQTSTEFKVAPLISRLIRPVIKDNTINGSQFQAELKCAAGIKSKTKQVIVNNSSVSTIWYITDQLYAINIVQSLICGVFQDTRLKGMYCTARVKGKWSFTSLWCSLMNMQFQNCIAVFNAQTMIKKRTIFMCCNV